jgi:hypothetical protein
MKITRKTAERLAKKLKIDTNKIPISGFYEGLKVELEHGTRDPKTDVTGDSLIKTGKIALAHLNEKKNYYTLLKKVEGESNGKAKNAKTVQKDSKEKK